MPSIQRFKTVAIVITYNASKWISQCLQSLQASSIGLNIVVIDNSSTDDTIAIIESHFPEVTLIKNNVNLGFGKANNIGFQYGLREKADYFFLLNQDAWIQPDTVEKLIQASLLHPSYYILSPLHLSREENKLEHHFSQYLLHAREEHVDTNIEEAAIVDVPFVNAALWLIPVRCINTIGGFDPLFSHYCEDNDLINRVHYHGFKIGIYKLAKGYHGRQINLLTLPEILQKPERLRVNYLLIFKNINNSLLQCLSEALCLLIYLTIRHLRHFRFKSAFLSFVVLKDVLKEMPLIVQHRKKCKYSSSPFIS